MAQNLNKLVFLRNYSNYFNRIIKRFDTLREYQDSCKYYVRNNRNFNPADGVFAEHLENIDKEPLNECDYLLVLDEKDNIVSRWFIVEADRTRGQQFKFSLKRDVIADNFSTVLNAPCYVEKGTLGADDDLIYNSEGLLVNQIKKDETQLFDKSKCPWIVGYIARDFLKQVDNNPVNPKTVYGIYGIEYDNAIDASTLPWKFDPNDKEELVGPVSGYKMELEVGQYHGKSSYGGPQSADYTYTNKVTINYDSLGNLVSASGKDNFSEAVGVIPTKYPTTDIKFNLVNSTTKLGYARDISDFIVSHKSLSIAKVPMDIVNQQVNNTTATNAQLLSYNNKIIYTKTSEGKPENYYRLTVTDVGTEDYAEYSSSSTTYSQELNDMIDEFLTAYNANAGAGNWKAHYSKAARPIKISAKLNGVKVTFEQITQEKVHAEIPIFEKRTHLNDGPYDMFCMPYGDVKLKKADVTTSKNAALGLAFYLAAELGSSVVYDMQLLPYCPVQSWIDERGELGELGTEGFSYSYVKDSDEKVRSIMIWCQNSSGTFNIDKKIELERPKVPVEQSVPVADAWQAQCSLGFHGDAELTMTNEAFKMYDVTRVKSISVHYIGQIYYDSASNPEVIAQDRAKGTVTVAYKSNDRNSRIWGQTLTPESFSMSECFWEKQDYANPIEVDTKISNECDIYRLVSPNFNGQFEFSLAKNKTSVTSFNVDYTYKPYAPYIHVNPVFNPDGLYGKDWDDSRGLICGGDFSLAAVTSAWTDYQVQNKNFQAMFDREIQNMDVNNSIQMQEAKFGAVAGVVKGAASGAAIGGIAGGIPGGVALGIAGAAASALGGYADISNLVKAQEEAKSFKTDMYNFSLQNVQALPYSLSKTSAFTYNNKIVPILEFYTCTKTEKDALREKLKYNGMTVMATRSLASVTKAGEEVYVQGQMIRLSDLSEDSHMAYAIYEEIKKGVYL